MIIYETSFSEIAPMYIQPEDWPFLIVVSSCFQGLLTKTDFQVLKHVCAPEVGPRYSKGCVKQSPGHRGLLLGGS